MDFILGVDLACRAAHVASLARRDGTFVWTGRKFCTRSTDLDRLWADLDLGAEDSLLVVMEPTRNAWAPVAAWFRRRGAEVVLVPTDPVRRPARLLRQAHQERPARLAAAGPAAAAAPRGAAPRRHPDPTTRTPRRAPAA